ncbi:hypothetical protein D3C75_1386890 [compost metagenome]
MIAECELTLLRWSHHERGSEQKLLVYDLGRIKRGVVEFKVGVLTLAKPVSQHGPTLRISEAS